MYYEERHEFVSNDVMFDWLEAGAKKEGNSFLEIRFMIAKL
jgi:hypothetical protein